MANDSGPSVGRRAVNLVGANYLSQYGVVGRAVSKKLGFEGSFNYRKTPSIKGDPDLMKMVMETWQIQDKSLANAIPVIEQSFLKLDKTIDDTADLLSRAIGNATIALATRKHVDKADPNQLDLFASGSVSKKNSDKDDDDDDNGLEEWAKDYMEYKGVKSLLRRSKWARKLAGKTKWTRKLLGAGEGAAEGVEGVEGVAAGAEVGGGLLAGAGSLLLDILPWLAAAGGAKELASDPSYALKSSLGFMSLEDRVKHLRGQDKSEQTLANRMVYDVERKIIFKAREITFKGPTVASGLSGTYGGIQSADSAKPKSLWQTLMHPFQSMFGGTNMGSAGAGSANRFDPGNELAAQQRLSGRSATGAGGPGGYGYGGGTGGAAYANGNGGGGVPANILAIARKAALTGGPGAVAKFMADNGHPQSGAWCGEFAAAVITAAGGTPPKNPALADNWKNWGEATETPEPGDIAVRRDHQGGYGHVTIYEGPSDRPGMFKGIGGNQGGYPEANFPMGGYLFRKPGTQPTPYSPGQGGSSGGAGASGQFAPTQGSNPYLQGENRWIQKELDADPQLRQALISTISYEQPSQGHAQQVAEALFNRLNFLKTKNPNLTLREYLSRTGDQQFYGPIKHQLTSVDNPRLNRGASASVIDADIAKALGGSNLIQGFQDQGSIGDPNYKAEIMGPHIGGQGVAETRGEIYGDMQMPGAEQWRQEQQRRVIEAAKTGQAGQALEKASPSSPTSWMQYLYGPAPAQATPAEAPAAAQTPVPPTPEPPAAHVDTPQTPTQTATPAAQSGDKSSNPNFKAGQGVSAPQIDDDGVSFQHITGTSFLNSAGGWGP